ncbi:hypothetical protein ACF0H5_020866 [Mactra antiquata]
MAVIGTLYCMHSLAIIGFFLFCGDIVDAFQRKEKVSTQPICQGHTYGELIGTYSIPSTIMCFAHCLYTSSCASFTFDESNEDCALNSKVLLDITTCDINMVYGQWKQYECKTNGDHRICGLDIYGTPGQISGHIFVQLPTGIWGTVCDDFWETPFDIKGDVFCHALGYSGGSSIYTLETHTDYYLNEQHPINIEDVICNGDESSLLSCIYLYATYCVHREDVHLTCFF